MEFKTLVIRILAELIELSHKMKEQMKTAQSEKKLNIQGTKSEAKDMVLKSKVWNRRKK